MKIDDLAVALQKRRTEMEANIFKQPPQDYESFIKQLGVWIGLSDALSIINDARKDDDG